MTRWTVGAVDNAFLQILTNFYKFLVFKKFPNNIRRAYRSNYGCRLSQSCCRTVNFPPPSD